MARSSADQSQAEQLAAQLADCTQDASGLPKYTQGQLKAGTVTGARVNSTQADEALPKRTQAQELASVLFDEALTAAKLDTVTVAELFGVSESLVRRMRSKDARERASFVQMLLLPPPFWFHLNALLNERFGLRRMLVAQLLNVTADLALAVER